MRAYQILLGAAIRCLYLWVSLILKAHGKLKSQYRRPLTVEMFTTLPCSHDSEADSRIGLRLAAPSLLLFSRIKRHRGRGGCSVSIGES